MGCLCIGMAVVGLQLLKSPAIVIVCAVGALDALSENSTLYGRATGFGFGGVGVGAGIDGEGVCVVSPGEGPGVGAGPVAVRGQKK